MNRKCPGCARYIDSEPHSTNCSTLVRSDRVSDETRDFLRRACAKQEQRAEQAEARAEAAELKRDFDLELHQRLQKAERERDALAERLEESETSERLALRNNEGIRKQRDELADALRDEIEGELLCTHDQPANCSLCRARAALKKLEGE